MLGVALLPKSGTCIPKNWGCVALHVKIHYGIDWKNRKATSQTAGHCSVEPKAERRQVGHYISKNQNKNLCKELKRNTGKMLRMAEIISLSCQALSIVLSTHPAFPYLQSKKPAWMDRSLLARDEIFLICSHPFFLLFVLVPFAGFLEVYVPTLCCWRPLFPPFPFPKAVNHFCKNQFPGCPSSH